MILPTILLIAEMTFPIVLFVAGTVFLLIGLLGKIEIKDFKLGTNSGRMCRGGVHRCLFMAAAFMIWQPDKPGRTDTDRLASRLFIDSGRCIRLNACADCFE